MEDKAVQFDEAIILIVAKMGYVYEVAKSLRVIEGINKVMIVTGTWDIVALLSYDRSQFSRLIKEVQALANIVQTLTLMVVPDES